MAATSAHERLEFRLETTAIPETAPAGNVPAGFAVYNDKPDPTSNADVEPLQHVLLGDKRAMAVCGADSTEARKT